MIPVLDLFAGYGGFTLGLEWASPRFQTIGFAEIDPYASAVLAHRFPDIPNLGNVCDITRASVLARCGTLPRVVTGGFPCQPHSAAGKRQSVADERDLWDECVRVLRELRPEFAIFENVAGLYTSESYTDATDGSVESGLFFNRVLSDLAALGYACSWETLSAADVGAPHRRDRVWLLCVDERVADSGESGLQGRPEHPGGLAPLGQRQAAGRQLGEGGGARGTWPALAGLWPARPGQPQFEWEPPRVVGDSTHNHGRRGISGAEARTGEARERQRRLAITSSGQAQPQLGGDADGIADRLDAVAGEVHEAEESERTANGNTAKAWLTPSVEDAARAGSLAAWEEYAINGRTTQARLRNQIHATQSSGEYCPQDTVNRTHRLKAIGNGIVPLCAAVFAMAILNLIEDNV